MILLSLTRFLTHHVFITSLLSLNAAALATLAILFVAAAFLATTTFRQSRWNQCVLEFCKKHHGYTTMTTTTTTVSHSSKKSPTPATIHDVLLIVCPTSGNGRAMKEYKPALAGLEAQGRQVEVYVTNSMEDLMTLAETKDLRPYAMIAILSGDSSVFEFVQPALRQNSGKWPFAAPILHLPGGCGNALPSEFYGPEILAVTDIIQQAKKVRKLSVVKASSKEGTVRFALHNCFDGLQVVLIDWLDDHRAFSSILGTACGLVANLLFFLLTFPFRRNMNPIVLNIVNSDFEGSGMKLGLGVTRFDSKMAVVTGGPYKSKYHVLPAYFHFLSSKLARNIKDGDELPYNLSCQVCDRFTTAIGYHYKLYFDGSSSLPLEGDEISFEVIPEAIPVMTVPYLSSR